MVFPALELTVPSSFPSVCLSLCLSRSLCLSVCLLPCCRAVFVIRDRFEKRKSRLVLKSLSLCNKVLSSLLSSLSPSLSLTPPPPTPPSSLSVPLCLSFWNFKFMVSLLSDSLARYRFGPSVLHPFRLCLSGFDPPLCPRALPALCILFLRSFFSLVGCRQLFRFVVVTHEGDECSIEEQSGVTKVSVTQNLV